MLSELKKLSKHTLIYGTGILLGKAIGFFLIPLYTHYLTPRDYGILELLDLTGYIMGEFFGMGLSESILRYYPYYSEEKDKKAVVSTAITFNFILGIIFTVTILCASKFLAKIILASKEYAYLFRILAINLFLGSIVGIMKSVLQVQQRSTFLTSISLIRTAIALFLNICFVALFKLDVKGILYSTLITSSLISAYLAVTILRYTSFSFQLSKLIKMLKYGLPFLPNGILMFIFNWSDRYILRIYSNMESIGLYALGYKIGMIAVFLISIPFNLIWRAYIFDVEKKPNAKLIYSRFATYYLLILLTVSLLIATLSKEIITILAAPSYLSAYKVIPLIVLSMVFMCSDNVFQVGILLKRKTHYLPTITAIAAFTNVFLNFILIPKYNMMGAALATAISFFVYILATYFVAQKIYFIPFETKRIEKILFCAILLFFFTNVFAFHSMFLSFVIKGIVTVSVFPFMLYFTGFLLPEEKVYLVHGFKFLRGYVIRPFTK